MRRLLAICALTVAPAAASSDFWRQMWQRSPAEFQERASRTMHSALDRLHGQRRHWLRPAAPTAVRTRGRSEGDALALLIQVWSRRDDPAFLLAACDELSAMVRSDKAVDELEAFLPQATAISTTSGLSLLSSLRPRPAGAISAVPSR